MTLSKEQKRSLAGLSQNNGYKLLISLVCGSEIEIAMGSLDAAHSRDEIVEAALVLRAWKKVRDELTRIPAELEDELKTEGDEVYG